MNGWPFDPEDDDEADYGLDLEDSEEMRCDGCGCTARDPCEGGCVWYRDNLCSRCA